MAWNSSKLKSVEHTGLTLKDEVTGHPLNVELTGYTPDSDFWRAQERKLSRRNEKQSVIIEKGQQRIEIDSNAADDRRALVVSCITGLYVDGKLEKDMDDVRLQLTNNADVQWIYDQWDAHVKDRAEFMGKPAPLPKGESDA